MRSYFILLVIIGAVIAALYVLGKGYKDHAIAEQAKAPQPEFTFVRKVDNYRLYKHKTLNLCLLRYGVGTKSGITQVGCTLVEAE